MGHDHDHGHASSRAEDRSRLRLVLLVTVSIVVVEVVGAWLSGSLALLADAAHMITDASGIVVALSASYLATLPSTSRRTWGYHRAEILAALLNAVVLIGLCTWFAYSGTRRLVEPEHVDSTQLVLFAGIGLAANLISLAILAARRESSMNMAAAFLEVAGDALGSFLAIVAGLVIWTTGFLRADSIVSLLIAVLIAPRAWRLMRSAAAVLLEATPPDLELDVVRVHLEGVDGVQEVHDLHAWLITSQMPAMSAHVTVSDSALAERGIGPVLDELSTCVAEHFGIHHATFQLEPASHRAHEDLGEIC